MTEEAQADFKLKNGGEFTLEQVSVGSTLTIREAESSLYRCTVKVNGVPHDLEGGALQVTVTPNMTVEFINTSRLADLTIQKRGADSRDEHQTFLFHIQGLDGDDDHIHLTTTVLGNGSVTVKDLPVGRYRITEDESWSWRYEAVSMTSAGRGSPAPPSTLPFPSRAGPLPASTAEPRADGWTETATAKTSLAKTALKPGKEAIK